MDGNFLRCSLAGLKSGTYKTLNICDRAELGRSMLRPYKVKRLAAKSKVAASEGGRYNG